MHEIPFWRTIEQAFRLVWEEGRDLVSLASLPVLVLALLAVVQAIVLPGETGDVTPDAAEGMEVALAPGQIMMLILNTGVSAFLYVAFAVAWHRKILLPAEVSTVATSLRWGRRQSRYLLLWLMVSVIASAPVMALVLFATALAGGEGLVLAPPVLAGAALATLFIYGRIVPLLPAAAIDRPLGIAASWSLTTGNGWRMVGVAFLPLFPVVVVQLLAAMVLGSLAQAIGVEQGLSTTFVAALLQYAITYAGVAITISALTLAYLHLTSMRTPRVNLTV